MLNALSIDLEFWNSGEPYSGYPQKIKEDQIEEALYPLLNLLDKYNTRSTFFILGQVAETHPSLIKEIYDLGHEISSHGYSHKRLHLFEREKFEEDIKESIKILYSITRERPIGYRAPSFSIDNSTKWALKILKNNGFKYDSSVFPIKTRLYGEPNVPLGPYNPSMEDITKIDPTNELIEFPLSVYKFLNRNIPISGGIHFRIIPYQLLRYAIRKINQKRPIIMYIHPWETYPNTPQINLPYKMRFVSYYGIDHTLKKFEKLLKEFKFTTIKDVLKVK